MSRLVLPVKAEYFKAILAGTKVQEFRPMTPHWCRRMIEHDYDVVEVTLGYPKAGDIDRRIVRPWNGYRTVELTHPHFGAEPVHVFAVSLWNIYSDAITADYWAEKCGPEWTSGRIAPRAVGFYRRMFSDGPLYQWWDGQAWLSGGAGTAPHWRTLGDYPCWKVASE